MQRFTISLDDDLAKEFDAFIAAKAYANRSEAVRDLIRARLGDAVLAEAGAQRSTARARVAACVANVSYVYDHHEQAVTSRVLDLQHEHHDLVVTSLHTHLDHHHCMETAVLRGAAAAVQALAEQLVAQRGVRHGNIHLVPLVAGQAHGHGKGDQASHQHFSPLT